MQSLHETLHYLVNALAVTSGENPLSDTGWTKYLFKVIRQKYACRTMIVFKGKILES